MFRRYHRRTHGLLCRMIATGCACTLLFGIERASLAAEVTVPTRQDGQELTRCGEKVSVDNRLVMEQWAVPGDCQKPTKTRVTDRFLGFTCLEETMEVVNCRAFLPAGGSRAFDTARYLRCIDIGITDSEEGALISRMREWVGLQANCEWDPSAELLAFEIDFVFRRVCIAGLCMAASGLSVVGRLRLRRAISTAFPELDLAALAFNK
jgi:hypothetical protein